MSAKYHQSTHVHPHPWSSVAAAIFRRYPNPFAAHVLAEDTVQRSILTGGSLYSRRVLIKTNRIPKWGETFFIGLKRVVPLVEESVVDAENKVIVTYTRNVGLSRLMSAVERVRYTENPDNPGETLAVKEAWIESGLYGFRSAVKNMGVERFRTNCQKATEGFNYVLNKLEEQRQQQLCKMRERSEAVREGARRAAGVARAKSTVHADGKASGEVE